MFDRDLEELELEDVSMNMEKIPLYTCNTANRTNSYCSPRPLSFEEFPEPLDLSIDCQLYLQNATQIEKAILSYLKTCILEDVSREDAFQLCKIFPIRSFSQLDQNSDNDIQLLVCNNPLLNEWSKKTLTKNLKEYHELSSLLGETKNLIGISLSQELVLIVYSLLETKIQSFKELLSSSPKNWVIPKFDRFCGDEDMENSMSGELRTFQDFTPLEISSFASAEVEQIVHKLYFSDKLRFLNLKEAKVRIKGDICVKEKFSSLVGHISRNIFLAMAGIAQTEDDLGELLAELAIHTSQQGVVTGCDLVKKVKLF